MVDKRGQTTIFIIIAVVVVAVVVLISVLYGDALKGSFSDAEDDISKLGVEAREVRSHVLNCLEESLETTLFINAYQGGYYLPPLNLDFGDIDLEAEYYVHYYLLNGKNFVPDRDIIEAQVSLGVKDLFVSCVDFSQFNYNVDFDLEDLEVRTLLEYGKVSLKVNFPITVTVEDSSSSFGKINLELESDYWSFYTLANELTQEQEVHLDSLCVSCIGDLSNRHNMQTSTVELFEGSYYIVIYYIEKIDKSFEIVDSYVFAHRFNLDEI